MTDAHICEAPDCDRSFTPRRQNARFCSNACRASYHRLEALIGRPSMEALREAGYEIRRIND